MTTFDEAWLMEHQRKMALVNGGALPRLPDRIEFTLSKPTPLLNVTLRTHWAKRRKQQAKLSAEIASLVPLRGAPIQVARVTISRFSTRTPDHDGMVGGAKSLIDCLLIRSSTHPNGLGLIFDDSPEHLILFVLGIVVMKRFEQRTEVVIERIR